MENTFINSIYFILVSVALFSLTDGFCIGSLFIFASEEGNNRAEKEKFGFIMVLSLTVGMLLGAVISLSFTTINIK